MRRRFVAGASVLLALLLVAQAPAAAAATGSTTTTTTTTSSDECTPMEYALYSVACPLPDDDPNETTADLADVHAHATGVKSTHEVSMVLIDNYLNDTRTQARMRMQVAVANAYKNGSSKSVAVTKAKEAITDYYTVKELNLVKSWNAMLANAQYMSNEAARHQTQENETVELFMTTGGDIHLLAAPRMAGNSSYTLMNGSTVDARVLNATEVAVITANGHKPAGTIDPMTLTDVRTNGSLTTERYTGSQYVQRKFYVDEGRIAVKHPDSSTYNRVLFLNLEDYRDRLQALRDQRQEMVNYAENFTQATYSEFESGNISADDLISRLTKIRGFQQDAIGPNASLSDIVIAASSMGLKRPNQSTGYMKVSFQTEQGNLSLTKKGMLLSSEAPTVTNGSWVADRTYNASELEGIGVVMFAAEDGSTYTVNTSHGVTIHSVVDTDGDQINGTTTEGLPDSEDYQTASTQEYIQLLNETNQYIEELEQEKQQQNSDNTETSGFGLPDGVSRPAVIALLLVAGAAALLNTRRDGGRYRR